MFEQVEAYYRPSSVREALHLLVSGKGRAKILAGGTDLVVDADSTVRALIDVSHSGIDYIRPKAGVCSIGAATLLADLEASPVIRRLAAGILNRAAAVCGSVQIRNAATVGGNIANGSPAADLVPALMALDASVIVSNLKGRRKFSIQDYLDARGTKSLSDSLLVEVAIPVPKCGRCGWSFQKLGRTELDIAIVNAAAGLQLDRAGRVSWCRIALGAVAPRVIRAAAVEEQMRGRKLDKLVLREAAEGVTREVSPITDHRASAEYRREMCGVLTRRALEECAAQAGCAL